MSAPALALNTAQTMSSREIADLCEARHNDVVATILRLFDQGVLRESRKTTRTVAPAAGGRPTQVYDLTKRDALVVVSGYSAELRAIHFISSGLAVSLFAAAAIIICTWIGA